MSAWRRSIAWMVACLLAATLAASIAGCHQEEKVEADYYTGKDFHGHGSGKAANTDAGARVAGKSGGRD